MNFRTITLSLFFSLSALLFTKCGNGDGYTGRTGADVVFTYENGTMGTVVSAVPSREGFRGTTIYVALLLTENGVLATSLESIITSVTFDSPTLTLPSGCTAGASLASANDYTFYKIYTYLTACDLSAADAVLAIGTGTVSKSGASRSINGSGNSSSSTNITEGHHTIFATSTTYNGNLEGLSGADSKCKTRAQVGSATSSLTGTWRAILSDATHNAKDRITFVSGYTVKNTHGQTVVSQGSDLWGGGTLTNAVAWNENNTAAAGTAWTGTGVFGNVVASVHCNSWTSNSAAISGNAGNPANKTSNWISLSVPNCSNSVVLYCLNSN